jgi:pimeloyl-ACP methyl ester carboxylesterase
VSATNETVSDYFFTSSDGLRLYCAVYPGERSGSVPVLCLPGLTRNSRDFTSLARRLQPRHEVLALDLRGRGRSAWDAESSHYQLPTYVQDVWSLLDSRSIPRVIVIGTSLGALMGMVMAAMRPDRIVALVLNDAGPEIDPVGVRRIQGYAGRLAPVATWEEAAAQAKSVYGSALPDLTDAEWLEYARRGYRENAAGVPVPDVDPKIAQALQQPAGTPPDLWPLYAVLRNTPMLVIRGALSDILSAATLERMVREKPDVHQLTVAGRGHAPLLNEPECLAAIDTFLASYAQRA